MRCFSGPLEAGGYYRAALSSRPAAAVGYCAVGDALQFQNEFVEAIDYYQQALKLDPSYARAQSNLGQALQAQGKFDEAISYYRKALELDPDYAGPTTTLATPFRPKASCMRPTNATNKQSGSTR